MKRVFLISSGRGPVECRRAVRAVAAGFIAAVEETGLDVDYIPGFDPDGEGPVSATILVVDAEGQLDALLSGWRGIIQWVAKSDRRGQASRKNWFVSLREEVAPAASTLSVRESDVAFSAITAGGPGGQHQNKTASAIRAEHRPSGVTVVVRSEPSQHRNKAIALQRIAAILDMRERAVLSRSERASWAGRIAVERGAPVRVITETDGKR